MPLFWNLRPFSIDVNARLHLLFERRDRFLHRAHRVERRRRHHVIHPIVERLDPEAPLFGRVIRVLRILRDLGNVQPPQAAVLVAHDRPEALEAGAAERGILREQEVAAPEALARDRAVGLRVDGEDHAGRVIGLRHAPHQHQQMPVGIGVDGPRPQRLLVQRHRIEIVVVVGDRGSPGAGMDGVGDDPQIPAERRREAGRLRRRSLRLGRRLGVGLGVRLGLSLRLGRPAARRPGQRS